MSSLRDFDPENLAENILAYDKLCELRGLARQMNQNTRKFLEFKDVRCPKCDTNRLAFVDIRQERAADEGSTLYLLCENGHKRKW